MDQKLLRNIVKASGIALGLGSVLAIVLTHPIQAVLVVLGAVVYFVGDLFL